MTDEVVNNKTKYGWTTKAFGGIETKGVRPLYEALFQGFAQRGVSNLILTTHLRTPWVKSGKENVPVVGKVTPSGRLAVLSRLSTAMFWLVPAENSSGAPAALVLKSRRAKRTYDKKNGWSVTSVLPRRIPEFSWQAMDEYMKHPADLSNPAEGEQPNENELNMMSELLTNEQMKLMIVGAEERIARGRLTPEQQIRHYHELGMPKSEIAETLGVTLPQINRALE